MMVVTAKVDKKKVIWIAAAAVAAIVLLFALFGGEAPVTDTSAPLAAGNDARIEFLKSFGWDIANSPTESSQVRIPEETSEVFDRYNQLQKSQGYDLSKLAGKNAMRYVYKVNNYPGATDPVYATVLVYKNQIVGGDVTDTSAKGKVQGFKMPRPTPENTAPTETVPVT
jgi:hypothetical protein